MIRSHILSALFTLILALLFGFSFADRAQAATYKCKENGKVTFSDKPCATATSKAVESKGKTTLSNGMHSSWFAHPAYSKQQVTCSDKACVCGEKESKITDKGTAVINAMSSLPGAWRSHYSTHKRFKELGLDKKRFPAYIERLGDMACRIKINQKIIQMHYQEVSAEINEEFFLTDKAMESKSGKCDAMLRDINNQKDKTKAMNEYKKNCSIKKHNEMVRAHKRSKPMVKVLNDSLKTLQTSRSAYIKQSNAKKR